MMMNHLLRNLVSFGIIPFCNIWIFFCQNITIIILIIIYIKVVFKIIIVLRFNNIWVGKNFYFIKDIILIRFFICNILYSINQTVLFIYYINSWIYIICYNTKIFPKILLNIVNGSSMIYKDISNVLFTNTTFITICKRSYETYLTIIFYTYITFYH